MAKSSRTVLDALQQGLQRAFTDDERVLLLGEDVLDPYGGAFKVTRGLSTRFPERVLTTPISEAAIVGVAGGMALRGLRPVVEIMFGDFVTLTADQVINHLTKFPHMYRQGVKVPVVIRTPMGGRRSYGATHSQSLEKIFLGVPGLRVLAAHTYSDPAEQLYQAIIHTQTPLLFVEHKLLYTCPVFQVDEQSEFEVRGNLQGGMDGWVTQEREFALRLERFQGQADDWITRGVYRVRLRAAPPPQVTLAAYGYMAELARESMLTLAYEDEIFSELLVFTQIAPLQSAALLDSLRVTGRLVTIEEGTLTLGWGAEVGVLAHEGLGSRLKGIRRVAAQDMLIPSARALEEQVLPSPSDIIKAVKDLMTS